MAALDLSSIIRFVFSFVPGVLVGLAVLAIAWLIGYAVTSLRGPGANRRPPQRPGY